MHEYRQELIIGHVVESKQSVNKKIYVGLMVENLEKSFSQSYILAWFSDTCARRVVSTFLWGTSLLSPGGGIKFAACCSLQQFDDNPGPFYH